MNAVYSIQWVPVTPEYILASFQEEWRQIALPDAQEERELPTFTTTIAQWRDLLDLVDWSRLGRALNEAWGTNFSRQQWREVLEPSRKKTLRGVCDLLASQAKRPLVPPAKLLGHECAAAGVFLAVRSLLLQAGVPDDLRPSTTLEPVLRKWPKVFQNEIARLCPGGLPFVFAGWFGGALTGLICLMGWLLMVVGSSASVAELIIVGVLLCGAGWIGGLFYHGPLALKNVSDFRQLAELIVEQQQRYGFAPRSCERPKRS